MKREIRGIRTIIRYLNSFNCPHLLRNRDAIISKLKDKGFREIGSGVYVVALRRGNLVVKIGRQNFNKLRGAGKNKVFRKYAPPIYLIHKEGKVLICKFVKILPSISYDLHDKKAIQMRDLLIENKFAGEDLHEQNLVRIKWGKKRIWKIIDYGCWIGNR
jgi:hypothetical protein